MHRISVDFETFSQAGYVFDGERWEGKGIGGVGHHLYARHPSTEVICLAYGPRLWTPTQPLPRELFFHLQTGGELAAWNADFEWQIWTHVCVRRYGFPPLRREQIVCSAARARCYGVPGKLGDAARFFPQGAQKQEQGQLLIRRYCVPRSPSKHNPALRRFLPSDPRFDPASKGNHDPYQDEALMWEYCKGDVRAEAAVASQCPPMAPVERKIYLLDQEINDRGVAVDMLTIEQLQEIVNRERARAEASLAFVTNPPLTPYQVTELTAEIQRRGVPITDLQKDTVERALEDPTLPPVVRVMLEARQAVAHTSVSKLDAIRRRVCSDGRVRGLLYYYGAERTGRWAGRGAQPQNLPRGDERTSPFEKPICTLDDVASCLRSVFVAGPGKRLIAADFSSIEAVVLAELAGEQWRSDVFRRREDIYSKTAEMVTGVPGVPGEKHPHRQLGKIAELASGYGGGVGAWRAFGHEGTKDEIQAAVRAWREASPSIVAFWWGLEDAAKNAIRSPGTVQRFRSVSYRCEGNVLQCVLPSGRSLWYHHCHLAMRPTPWGAEKETIVYFGQDTFTRQWGELRTYGGKLCENVVQAAARDLLAYAMLRVAEAGYSIVLHVHDEIVCEEPQGRGSVEELCWLMTLLPTWARGWPVRAAGWEGKRYRKD